MQHNINNNKGETTWQSHTNGLFPNFETNSENVVKTIHWRYTATETVGEDTHTASMYGSCAGSDGMNF